MLPSEAWGASRDPMFSYAEAGNFPAGEIDPWFCRTVSKASFTEKMLHFGYLL
jgi:hypothetical protein